MRKFIDMITKDDKLITSILPMGDGIGVIRGSFKTRRIRSEKPEILSPAGNLEKLKLPLILVQMQYI